MKNSRKKTSHMAYRLDRFDKDLICELAIDGKQNYVHLGKKFGVAEATVRKRVKRLQETGILRIIAVPSLAKLGYGFVGIMALQVGLSALQEVAKRLSENANVCYVTFVTGRYDLIALVVTKSQKELSSFIKTEISAMPGVVRSETFVNLDIIKGDVGLVDTTQILKMIDTS